MAFCSIPSAFACLRYRLLLLACTIPQAHTYWRTVASDGDDTATATSMDVEGNIIAVGMFSGDSICGMTNLKIGRDDVFLAKYNSSGALLWMKTLGTSGQDAVTAVKVDKASNIYVVGSTQRALPGGGRAFVGDWDVFIAKFGPDGNRAWVRQFGTPYADEGLSLALFEPNSTAIPGSEVQLFITGYTKGYMNQAPGDGGMLWHPHYQFSLQGLASSRCRGVVADPSGDIVVVGDSDGDMAALSGTTISIGQAAAHELVDTLPDGTLRWRSGDLHARSSLDLTSKLLRGSILRLRQSTHILLLRLSCRGVFNSTHIPLETFVSYDSALDDDRRFPWQGTETTNTTRWEVLRRGVRYGRGDGFIAKIAVAEITLKALQQPTSPPQGTMWLRQVGSLETDALEAVSSDQKGNFYTVGQSQGDMCITVHEGGGGGSDEGSISAAYQTSSATGQSKSAPHATSFVQKYSSQGRLLWMDGMDGTETGGSKTAAAVALRTTATHLEVFTAGTVTRRIGTKFVEFVGWVDIVQSDVLVSKWSVDLMSDSMVGLHLHADSGGEGSTDQHEWYLSLPDIVRRDWVHSLSTGPDADDRAFGIATPFVPSHDESSNADDSSFTSQSSSWVSGAFVLVGQTWNGALATAADGEHADAFLTVLRGEDGSEESRWRHVVRYGFAASAVQVPEPLQADGRSRVAATVRVTRSDPCDTGAVDYSVAGLTATLGIDFQLPTATLGASKGGKSGGVLVFGEGVVERIIPIEVLRDDEKEPVETAEVKLLNPRRGSGSSRSGGNGADKAVLGHNQRTVVKIIDSNSPLHAEAIAASPSSSGGLARTDDNGIDVAKAAADGVGATNSGSVGSRGSVNDYTNRGGSGTTASDDGPTQWLVLVVLVPTALCMLCIARQCRKDSLAFREKQMQLDVEMGATRPRRRGSWTSWGAWTRLGGVGPPTPPPPIIINPHTGLPVGAYQLPVLYAEDMRRAAAKHTQEAERKRAEIQQAHEQQQRRLQAAVRARSKANMVEEQEGFGRNKTKQNVRWAMDGEADDCSTPAEKKSKNNWRTQMLSPMHMPKVLSDKVKSIQRSVAKYGLSPWHSSHRSSVRHHSKGAPNATLPTHYQQRQLFNSSTGSNSSTDTDSDGPSPPEKGTCRGDEDHRQHSHRWQESVTSSLADPPPLYLQYTKDIGALLAPPQVATQAQLQALSQQLHQAADAVVHVLGSSGAALGEANGEALWNFHPRTDVADQEREHFVVRPSFIEFAEVFDFDAVAEEVAGAFHGNVGFENVHEVVAYCMAKVDSMRQALEQHCSNHTDRGLAWDSSSADDLVQAMLHRVISLTDDSAGGDAADDAAARVAQQVPRWTLESSYRMMISGTVGSTKNSTSVSVHVGDDKTKDDDVDNGGRLTEAGSERSGLLRRMVAAEALADSLNSDSHGGRILDMLGERHSACSGVDDSSAMGSVVSTLQFSPTATPGVRRDDEILGGSTFGGSILGGTVHGASILGGSTVGTPPTRTSRGNMHVINGNIGVCIGAGRVVGQLVTPSSTFKHSTGLSTCVTTSSDRMSGRNARWKWRWHTKRSSPRPRASHLGSSSVSSCHNKEIAAADEVEKAQTGTNVPHSATANKQNAAADFSGDIGAALPIQRHQYPMQNLGLTGRLCEPTPKRRNPTIVVPLMPLTKEKENEKERDATPPGTLAGVPEGSELIGSLAAGTTHVSTNLKFTPYANARELALAAITTTEAAACLSDVGVPEVRTKHDMHVCDPVTGRHITDIPSRGGQVQEILTCGSPRLLPALNDSLDLPVLPDACASPIDLTKTPAHPASQTESVTTTTRDAVDASASADAISVVADSACAAASPGVGLPTLPDYVVSFPAEPVWDADATAQTEVKAADSDGQPEEEEEKHEEKQHIGTQRREEGSVVKRVQFADTQLSASRKLDAEIASVAKSVERNATPPATANDLVTQFTPIPATPMVGADEPATTGTPLLLEQMQSPPDEALDTAMVAAPASIETGATLASATAALSELVSTPGEQPQQDEATLTQVVSAVVAQEAQHGQSQRVASRWSTMTEGMGVRTWVRQQLEMHNNNNQVTPAEVGTKHSHALQVLATPSKPDKVQMHQQGNQQGGNGPSLGVASVLRTAAKPKQVQFSPTTIVKTSEKASVTTAANSQGPGTDRWRRSSRTAAAATPYTRTPHARLSFTPAAVVGGATRGAGSGTHTELRHTHTQSVAYQLSTRKRGRGPPTMKSKRSMLLMMEASAVVSARETAVKTNVERAR